MKTLITIIACVASLSTFACVTKARMTVCHGDRAIVKDGDGIVVGINPNLTNISIDFSQGSTNYRGINTYAPENVTIAKGCVVGICIGDRAFVKDGKGEVIGVNPNNGKISLNFTDSFKYHGINTYDYHFVTVAKGCLKNFCVGQKVIVKDGDGVIVAVGPYTDQVTIDFSQGNSQYSGINSYNTKDVTLMAR